MVEILSLVLQHDEKAVLSAVAMALQAGVPTKVHILNLLHRLVDGKPVPVPVVDAPQAFEPGQRTEGQCRALRCAGPNSGDPPCVMIPQVPPSSSCSGA